MCHLDLDDAFDNSSHEDVLIISRSLVSPDTESLRVMLSIERLDKTSRTAGEFPVDRTQNRQNDDFKKTFGNKNFMPEIEKPGHIKSHRRYKKILVRSR